MNQKGGVGKTSTCFHLAGTLSKAGRRVLAVDNDPQASLTQGFLGPDGMRSLDPAATISTIYAGADPMPGALIQTVEGLPGVSLLPSGESLNNHNVAGPGGLPVEQQGALAQWLAGIADDYDDILIDCPPNLCLCSWASLLAADALVIPLQPEDFGAQGLAPIRMFGNAARSMGNPGLRMLGYLPTCVVGTTTIHRTYLAGLRDLYGPLVFGAMMPRLVGFPEAVSNRRPVAQHDPKGKAAEAMEAIASEILARYTATEPGGGHL